MVDGRSVFSSRLPAAAAVLATGIFIADTATRVDIAVAVLYVAVVLLSARFCKPSGVALVAAGCAALTVVSYLITRNTGPASVGVVNTIIGLGAIALITPLVLRSQSREYALRRSEAYLAEAQRLTHTGSWAYDPSTGETTYWSEELFRIFGLDSEQGPPTSKAFWERIHPDDRDGVNAGINRALREKKEYVLDYRILSPDGTLKQIHSITHSVISRSGEVVELVGTALDVTDRRRAEEALRRSEEELRNLFNAMPAIAFIARADGFTDFQSRRWLEYSGLPAEASLGHGWKVALHPDDLDGCERKWQAALASGEPVEDERRLRNAKGDYCWVLARVVPLRDGQGKILKWYGVLTDIDDRKRAESLLAGEKHILEMVAKGDSLDQTLESLCRLAEEQIRGGLASIVLLDRDRLRRGAAPSLPTAYIDTIDGAVIGPTDGFWAAAAYRSEQVIVQDIAADPLWADCRDAASPYSLRACWSTPVFSSQGKVIAIFVIYFRDPRSPSPRDQELINGFTHLAGVVTERKLIQEALRRSEAHLAQAQRLTQTGSWSRSAKGDVYWSDEMFRIWGFEPMERPPDRNTVLQRVHPDDRDAARENGDRGMRCGTAIDQEYRIILPDGTVKHIHAVGHPIYSASGEMLEMVGTVVDVTERKRAQEERERLRQLEANLAHMNRISVMGEMSASVAHELKQPLAAAVMNAEVCLELLHRDQVDVQESSDATSAILRSVRRAAGIIDRLRSLSRKSNPERELVDVNQVIHEIGTLLQNEARMSSVEIHMELGKQSPQVTGDRVQLQQVVMNLMLNALESMKQKPGHLVVGSELTQEGQVLISVSDSGVGLPEGKEERIFDAFFTTKSQGTGMGLAICRSIVESHGGRLSARRNAGCGATFYVQLPQHGGEPA